MPGKLERYQEMRDFEKTREPRGDVVPGEERRFVIQEHHARALHWDHRFEHEGVLLSFAVPKGTPPDPRVNHLAVHTEDHPIEYLDFDGEIPEGEYGGGTMKIWDRGTYDLHELTDKKLTVDFHGERARGRYALFQTRGNQWMIHRMDPPEDPTRDLLPDAFAPTTATVEAKLPGGDGWVFEPAWGGFRANVGIEGGRVAWAVDEDSAEISGPLVELARMAEWQDVTPMVLDVEVVILGDDGRPDADLLAARRKPGLSRARVLTHAKRHPATVAVCDLLWYDGHSLTQLPADERRAALERLALKGPTWTTSTVSHDGDALLAAVNAQGLPGVRGRHEEHDLVWVAP
ncbi:MAG TPA: DNA polymerase ligase N-terminal domain-containing protein [Acidimicrobiales bacterium]|nr:DNA polymerase ligase N-terminal domain-containing protein [Acidimicrobiales bacterium]